MAEDRRQPLLQSLLLTVSVIIVSCFYKPVFPIQIEEICYEDTRRCAPSLCGTLPHRQKPTINCRCDRRCSLYDDCCDDYFDHCVNNDTNLPITSSKYSPFFKCVTTSKTNLADTFIVVGRCPGDWPDDGVRQNCENETLERSQRMLTLLVTGPDETVFKNVYCAVCHRIPENQLQIWSIKVWNCEYDAYGRYIYATCDGYQLLPPTSMRDDPHRCFQDYVDNCPLGISEALTEQCDSYTSVVFNVTLQSRIEIVAYKNVYCKYCNDFITNKTAACYPFPSLLNPFQFSTLTFNVAQRTVFGVETQGFFVQEQSLPQQVGNCSELQLFDPFQDRCRNLTCPGEMQLQDDVCVFSEDEGCIQDLLLPDFITSFLDGNFPNQYQITSEQNPNSQGNRFYINADFSIAKLIQESLDQMLQGGQAVFPCNTTTLMLVASSQAGTANESWWPICEGVTLENVHFNDVSMSDGFYHLNTSGYVYRGMDFMHVTTYNLTANEVVNQTSRRSCVMLCSPFVDCLVVAFRRSEFFILNSGEQTVFVHKTSPASFRQQDVWQLPDGTLRMCEFMLGGSARPLWLTTLSDVTFSCGVFSSASLLLTLVVYSLFPALRNQSGKIIINLIVALFLAQVALLGGNKSPPQICVVRATLLHFTWLAVFLWVTVMAIDLAYSIRSNSPLDQPRESNYKVVKLGMLAWGFPAVFVSACYLVSRLSQDQPWVRLEYGGGDCWITDPIHSLLVFGVPVAVLLLINLVSVIVMIHMMTANQRLATEVKAKASKMKLILFSKLFLVIGLAWSAFLVDSLLKSDAFRYVAVAINALQGALIGVILLLHNDARVLVAGKLLCWSRDARPDTVDTLAKKVLPSGSQVAVVDGVGSSGDMEANSSVNPQLEGVAETA